MNLRKLAQGKPCLIRLPGCNGGGETTVLCHYRMPGDGMGRKPPDERGAWGCNSCHDIADGRVDLKGWTRDEIRLAHAEGVFRTQEALCSLT